LAAADGDVTDAAPENVLGVPLVAVTVGTSLAAGLAWTVDKQNVSTVMHTMCTWTSRRTGFWIRLDRRAGHVAHWLRLPAPRRVKVASGRC
jgi:hypothetical protein